MTPTHAQIAAQVRRHKARYPWRYCPVWGCLWRTGDGSRCPRHRQAAR